MFESILKIAENIGYRIIDKEPPKKQHAEPEGIPSPSQGYLFYQIKPFRENENGIAYRQSFLKNFSTVQDRITFFLIGNKKVIKMYAHIPIGLQHYFENIFNASFPTSDLEITEKPKFNEHMTFINYGQSILFTESHFQKEGTYFDPLKDIFTTFEPLETPSVLTIAFTYGFQQKKSGRAFFLRTLSELMSFFVKKKEETKEGGEKEEPKKIDVYFSLGYSIMDGDPLTETNVKTNLKNQCVKVIDQGKIEMKPQQKFIGLSLTQVNNFFHLPTRDYFIKSLDYAVYRKLPAPSNLPTLENSEKNDITLLGFTDHKGKALKFGIRNEDKFRHMYIVGKTGTGKSTLISNMVKSDMITNKGLCLIDPHGDLIDTALEHIPSWRTNDVVLFDISDYHYPIGFNLLQYSSEEEKNLVVSGVISTFKKLYGNSRGPRLEYILRNVVLSVVEYPNATLLAILRVLTDKLFKEEVVSYVKDPNLLKFRRGEFDKRSDNMRQEAIAPITNKVGQFLSSSIVRNIFGQPMSTLNFRKIMDEGKILLVNLSKGKVGEDNTQMIGSFLVTKMQIDAMARADIAFKDRKEFYLYIDEFQNFATESFGVILSEARKYKLSLIVANQFLSQLEETIRNAIFGNVGTIISFTLGYDDARIMSSQFKELITPNDTISLPKFKAYIKLMIDGITSDPFSMRTLPLSSPEQSMEIKEKMRTQSRQRYGMEKEKLEELVKAWTNKTFSPVEKVVEKAMGEQGDGNSKPGEPIFTVNDIVLKQTYDGYVKLKYNYGIFVTVKGVEGLLHKNHIVNPNPNVKWEDFYNIGDKITVKAIEFKDIKGEKKVVWSQK